MQRRLFVSRSGWLVGALFILGTLLPASTALADVTNPSNNPVLANPGIYVVFWGSGWNDSTPDAHGVTPFEYQHYLGNFLNSIGGSPWLNTVTQYGVANPPGQLLGSWVDTTNSVPYSTNPLERHPNQDDIGKEAQAAVQYFGASLPATGGTVRLPYVVLVALPPGLDDDTMQTQAGCARHDAYQFTSGGTTYLLPYIALSWQLDAVPPVGSTQLVGCGYQAVNKTNDVYGHGALDSVSMAAGHEYAEALTDPFYNHGLKAWTDYSQKDTPEIGDLCGSNGLNNIRYGSLQYFAVQPLWSNQNHGGCVIGGSPSLELQESSLGMGTVGVGSTAVSAPVGIYNKGYTNLHIGRMSMAGPNAGEFQITNDTCSNTTLPPAMVDPTTPWECSFSVTFKPTALGTRSATLSINSDDSVSLISTLSLVGTGSLLPLPFPNIPLNPPASGCATCTGGSASGQGGVVNPRVHAHE